MFIIKVWQKPDELRFLPFFIGFLFDRWMNDGINKIDEESNEELLRERKINSLPCPGPIPLRAGPLALDNGTKAATRLFR